MQYGVNISAVRRRSMDRDAYIGTKFTPGKLSKYQYGASQIWPISSGPPGVIFTGDRAANSNQGWFAHTEYGMLVGMVML